MRNTVRLRHQGFKRELSAGMTEQSLIGIPLLTTSRRTAVGLAGCAPRFVSNRGHPALVPDASGP